MTDPLVGSSPALQWSFMTVGELKARLDAFPADMELVILDVTDENPEDAITLYVDDVSRPDPNSSVYLMLKS